MEVGTKLIGYEMTLYLLDALQVSSYLDTPRSGKEILALLEDNFRSLATDPHCWAGTTHNWDAFEPNLTTRFKVRFFGNEFRFCGATNCIVILEILFRCHFSPSHFICAFPQFFPPRWLWAAVIVLKPPLCLTKRLLSLFPSILLDYSHLRSDRIWNWSDLKR